MLVIFDTIFDVHLSFFFPDNLDCTLSTVFFEVGCWSREFSNYQVVSLKKLYHFCDLHTRR
jgi:hypothetical protein